MDAMGSRRPGLVPRIETRGGRPAIGVSRLVQMGLALGAAAVLLGGTYGASGAQAVPAATATARPSPTPERDWDVPAGHYFTQAGAGQGGYTIGDDDGLQFWSAYQRLGGVNTLGYPASRRFVYGGFVYQATQAALLQWRPDQQAAVLGNTFELLQEAGKDDWLASARGIPRPIASDGSTSFEEAVRLRLEWLTEPAIRARYLANPNPAAIAAWSEPDSIALYGLAMSRPERFGPFVTQRFQRIAFQLWVDAIAGMPPPGAVTAVLGGDLMKEAGIITGAAAQPHPAAALVSRAVALGATAFPTAASFDASPTATPNAAQRQTATADAARATQTAAAVRTPTPRPATTPPAVATARPGTIQLFDTSLSEYAIVVPQTTARVGAVRFALSNVGAMRHNLRVVGEELDMKSADVRPGQSGQLDVTFTAPGAYTVYCDVGDHAAAGMTLTLTVE